MQPLQNDLLIRSLASADVPQVRALHKLILPVQYPPAFFTQLLVLPARACLLVCHSSQPKVPIAFISAALHKPSTTTHLTISSQALNTTHPCVEILTLGVLPAYRHLGLAKQLIKAVVDKLCGPLNTGVVVYANVATTNTVALRFYEGVGLHISSDIIYGLYRTCSYGSRDAYLVSGCLDGL